MRKKIYNMKATFSIIFSFLFMILSSYSVFASNLEKSNEELIKLAKPISNQTNSKEDKSSVTTKSLNGIPITVTPDKNGVNVYVGNVGLDPLDSVSVKVKATGYSATKTSQAVSVCPVVGKNFYFRFPMIKCDMDYDATITIVDGVQMKTLYGHADLYYNDQTLSFWHRGTFGSKVASVQYHFDKHKNDIGVRVSNIQDYINSALIYRDKIKQRLASGNMSGITVTKGTGSIASKKYKNNIDGRFIILTNSNQEILSFGGK